MTNGKRARRSHLAAYIMWRLNWIHPFADGNGRTSRILSYVVLSVRAGAVPPGTPTIPDQIVDNRAPYFDALDAADAAWLNGRIDVSKMEELLGALFAKQLAGARRREAKCRILEMGYDDRAAERGTVDDVIMPHATRPRIAEMPGRKHDNLPV